MTRRRGALSVALGLALVLGTSTLPAVADGVRDLPGITEQELRGSVMDIELAMQRIDLTGSTTNVAKTRSRGKEQVITLTADILFGFGKAELPPAARSRIGALVREVPRRARLAVEGHTDSIGSAASNRALSLRRAEAVAAAIRTARPDLRLAVTGFGEAHPVAPNESGGEDNPEGRAKNRRVELRHRG